MSELSPAAQEVLDAFNREARPEPHHQREAIAATLRAVAMEVVLDKYQYADWQMADMIIKEIQAIANELET